MSGTKDSFPSLGTPTDLDDSASAAPVFRASGGELGPTANERPLNQPEFPPGLGDSQKLPPGQPEQLPKAAQANGKPPLEPKFVPALTAPPLEMGDIQLPINLPAALRLADGRPLLVSAAMASVWVADARLARARVLWVPTLNIGGSFTRHDGYGPDLNRGQNTAAKPLNQNDNLFYGGFGLTQMVNLTDAIFEPLAAKQALKSTEWNVQTAKNNALYLTAAAYFNVHERRGKYAAALDVVRRGKLLVERLRDQAKDLVPQVEVDRALNALADFQQQAAVAREEWRIHSANLTQVLRLDPRAVVVPLERDHLQITLIDPARPLDELVPIGLTNRPELASQQALVQAVLVRIRQEKLRPVLPSVVINGLQTPGMLYQGGVWGEGSGANMNLWSFRDDISIQFIWTLDSMGLGNMARIKKRRAEYSDKTLALFRAQDAVAQDVTDSQAKVQSTAVRVLQAERTLREAVITYDGNYEGLRQTKQLGRLLVLVYRPQEVVVALEKLKTAYDQYFSTVAEYNRAQFQLFHALGYPAREIEQLRSPGEPMPVDTNRPAYLPKVVEGAPAATH